MSPPPLSPSQAQLQLVESARYALLRRLAFAMRHEMVAHLQPIGMVVEVMERRLRAPAPDLAQLQEAVGKVQGFSRQAAHACVDVFTWLSPDASATVTLDEAIEETTRLLRSNLSFRGITLRIQEESHPQPVHKAAMRMMLPACLLALGDEAPSPAELVLTVEPGDGEATIDMRLVPTPAGEAFASEPSYRPLAWHEVEALARSEGLWFERGEGWLRLTTPLHETA